MTFPLNTVASHRIAEPGLPVVFTADAETAIEEPSPEKPKFLLKGTPGDILLALLAEAGKLNSHCLIAKAPVPKDKFDRDQVKDLLAKPVSLNKENNRSVTFREFLEKLNQLTLLQLCYARDLSVIGSSVPALIGNQVMRDALCKAYPFAEKIISTLSAIFHFSDIDLRMVTGLPGQVPDQEQPLLGAILEEHVFEEKGLSELTPQERLARFVEYKHKQVQTEDYTKKLLDVERMVLALGDSLLDISRVMIDESKANQRILSQKLRLDLEPNDGDFEVLVEGEMQAFLDHMCGIFHWCKEEVEEDDWLFYLFLETSGITSAGDNVADKLRREAYKGDLPALRSALRDYEKFKQKSPSFKAAALLNCFRALEGESQHLFFEKCPRVEGPLRAIFHSLREDKIPFQVVTGLLQFIALRSMLSNGTKGMQGFEVRLRTHEHLPVFEFRFDEGSFLIPIDMRKAWEAISSACAHDISPKGFTTLLQAFGGIKNCEFDPTDLLRENAGQLQPFIFPSPGLAEGAIHSGKLIMERLGAFQLLAQWTVLPSRDLLVAILKNLDRIKYTDIITSDALNAIIQKPLAVILSPEEIAPIVTMLNRLFIENISGTAIHWLEQFASSNNDSFFNFAGELLKRSVALRYNVWHIIDKLLEDKKIHKAVNFMLILRTADYVKREQWLIRLKILADRMVNTEFSPANSRETIQLFSDMQKLLKPHLKAPLDLDFAASLQPFQAKCNELRLNDPQGPLNTYLADAERESTKQKLKEKLDAFRPETDFVNHAILSQYLSDYPQEVKTVYLAIFAHASRGLAKDEEYSSIYDLLQSPAIETLFPSAADKESIRKVVGCMVAACGRRHLLKLQKKFLALSYLLPLDVYQPVICAAIPRQLEGLHADASNLEYSAALTAALKVGEHSDSPKRTLLLAITALIQSAYEQKPDQKSITQALNRFVSNLKKEKSAWEKELILEAHALVTLFIKHLPECDPGICVLAMMLDGIFPQDIGGKGRESENFLKRMELVKALLTLPLQEAKMCASDIIMNLLNKKFIKFFGQDDFKSCLAQVLPLEIGDDKVGLDNVIPILDRLVEFQLWQLLKERVAAIAGSHGREMQRRTLELLVKVLKRKGIQKEIADLIMPGLVTLAKQLQQNEPTKEELLIIFELVESFSTHRMSSDDQVMVMIQHLRLSCQHLIKSEPEFANALNKVLNFLRTITCANMIKKSEAQGNVSVEVVEASNTKMSLLIKLAQAYLGEVYASTLNATSLLKIVVYQTIAFWVEGHIDVQPARWKPQDIVHGVAAILNTLKVQDTFTPLTLKIPFGKVTDVTLKFLCNCILEINSQDEGVSYFQIAVATFILAKLIPQASENRLSILDKLIYQVTLYPSSYLEFFHKTTLQILFADFEKNGNLKSLPTEEGAVRSLEKKYLFARENVCVQIGGPLIKSAVEAIAIKAISKVYYYHSSVQKRVLDALCLVFEDQPNELAVHLFAFISDRKDTLLMNADCIDLFHTVQITVQKVIKSGRDPQNTAIFVEKAIRLYREIAAYPTLGDRNKNTLTIMLHSLLFDAIHASIPLPNDAEDLLIDITPDFLG